MRALTCSSPPDIAKLKNSARMASVAFMFNRVGLVRVAVPKEGITNDEVASKVTQIIETGLGADCLDFHPYPESEKEAVIDVRLASRSPFQCHGSDMNVVHLRADTAGGVGSGAGCGRHLHGHLR